MKTRLFLIPVLFFGVFSIAHAQFRSGIKGGFTFSRFAGDVDPFAKNSKYYEDYIGFQKIFRSGATGGLFTEFRINSVAKIGAEVLFSAKGAKYRYHNTKVYIVDEDGNKSRAFDTYTYQTDYLEVPVFVQLEPHSFRNIRFAFYGGLAPAISINRKRVYRYYDHEGLAAKGDEKKKKRELENVRTVNVFPLVGLKLGSDDAFFDIRYGTTLLPVFGNKPVSADTDFNTRMNSLSATLGVYF